MRAITRLEKSEKAVKAIAHETDVILWAELLGSGRVIVRYQDGRRVEVNESEIPYPVKCYGGGLSPDDWDKAKP